MSNKILRCAAALSLSIAVSACHVRGVPLIATPPGFSASHESIDAELNKKVEATLSEDGNHYLAGFRYEVPAAGSLIATAKPVNPAAQITLSVLSEGSGTAAVAKGEPGKKVEATELQAGIYYVLVEEPWVEAVKTRVALTTIFKPADPDHANGVYKTQPGSRELQADKGSVSDTVDYSRMRRTNWWKIPLNAEGGLIVKFDPNGANLSAEFVPPQGAPEKIDPTVGLKKDDLPPGDYFVKVFANDAGDNGRYLLTTLFKQGDTCKNGGPACSLEGAEELKLPSDSKTADVDYGKSKQFHFYKLGLKEKGKLTINFKVLQPPRGSKIGAFLMRSVDDEGDKISGTSVTREIDTPGDLFIRVQAPDQGDFGKYALATIFAPNNFIAADVVEIGKPCMLTVSAGTNQNVRAGAACTVVTANGQAIDGCVVDQVFPNLSKVRPSSPGCRIPNNAKIQIATQ